MNIIQCLIRLIIRPNRNPSYRNTHISKKYKIVGKSCDFNKNNTHLSEERISSITVL